MYLNHFISKEVDILAIKTSKSTPHLVIIFVMLKFIKLLIGLLLLPLCTAATRCAYQLLSESANTSREPFILEEWALPIGFILWLITYFIFPKPQRTYILAHEFTHALWGLLLGARVGKMRIGHDGGSVELSKTNFIIALSPYFFPLYTVVIILTYLTLQFFTDVTPWRGLSLALIGFTWSFHITFTIATLTQHQSDIHEHGRLFSYGIIYLFNLLGICCWITAIGAPDWNHFISLLSTYSTTSYSTALHLLHALPARLHSSTNTGLPPLAPH